MSLFFRKIFKNNRQLNIILENFSWMVITRVIIFLIRFVTIIFVTRYLGPERFGLYSYILAFISLFEPIADLGINQLVISELAKNTNNDEKSNILSAVFILKIIGSACAILFYIGGIIISNLKDISPLLFGIMGITLPLKSFDFIKIWFVSESEQRKNSIAGIVSVVVSSLLRFFAILCHASLEIFGLIFSIEGLILSLILLFQFFYTKPKNIVLKKINPFKYKWLIVNTLYLMVSGMATFIYMKIDQVMLGQISGITAVGVYSAAVKLSESWYIIPVALTQSSLPFLSYKYHADSEQYYHRLLQLMKIVICTGYLIALFFSVFGNSIIDKIYGVEFKQATIILKLHAWSGVFIGLDLVRNIWLTNARKIRLSLFFSLSGAVLNIFLNFILIPQYAALGATVATLISYIVSTYICCFCFSDSRRLAFLMSYALFLGSPPNKEKNKA